jgi:PAS domain S-box-containing protein
LVSRLPLTEFLHQIPDGLFITDAERRIVYGNKAAEEITGFRCEDLIGRHCYDPDTLNCRTLLGQEICSDEKCPLYQTIASNRVVAVPGILLINTKSGKGAPISLSVGPLQDAGGEAIGCIALFRGEREEYRQRKLALEIQKRMITYGEIRRAGLHIDTLYSPLEEIGGDYLETFFLDNGDLIATVADATGHGMTASLFTMVYKTLLHSAFGRFQTPLEVLGDVNRGFLSHAGIEGYYLSACIVRFDPKTRTGSYTSAGHPEGLIFTPEAEGFRLRRKLHIVSFMLGIEEEARYEELPFSLDPGEFLMLASDGLFESECYNGMAYGVPGVQRFFAGRPGEHPLEELLATVKRESKYVRLPDDLSMLTIIME